MPKRALPLTMGAMMIALFGLMLLLERQTGGLLLGAFVLLSAQHFCTRLTEFICHLRCKLTVCHTSDSVCSK